MFQPSGHFIGAGLSLAEPSGAPAYTHATIFCKFRSLNRRSFAKWPYLGSANHGGIFLEATAAFIALAQGRVLSYVRNDMGPISPGRWQPWQFFCRIGRTSLLKVTAAVLASAAKAMLPAINAAAR